MDEENLLGKCANCSAHFGAPISAVQDSPDGNENHWAKKRAKIVTFITDINGQDQAVHVFDALTEIYKLNWLHKIGEDSEILKSELILCSECSYVFSQLYKLFSEFQLLRKADSILSARLNVINSVVDVLLENSDCKDFLLSYNNEHNHEIAESIANGNGEHYGNDSQALLEESGVQLPGIMQVKREDDFDELFPVVTSTESLLADDGTIDPLGDRDFEDVNDSVNEFPLAVFETIPEEPSTQSPEQYESTTEMFHNSAVKLEHAHTNIVDLAENETEEIFGLDHEELDPFSSEVLNEDSNSALPEFKCYCVDCNMEFQTTAALGNHRQSTHGTDEIYKCHMCLKIISCARNLKLHLMRHSDHRPYRCRICKRGFKTNKDMRQHIRGVHSEESRLRRNRNVITRATKKLKAKIAGKIYKCVECGKQGFSAAGLYSHTVQCHNKRDRKEVQMVTSPNSAAHPGFYECHYCGQVFMDGCEFDTHVRSHSQQTVECRFCHQLFLNASEHNKHCAEYHPEQSYLPGAERAITGSVEVAECNVGMTSQASSTSLSAATAAALEKRIPVSTGPYGVTVVPVEPVRSTTETMFVNPGITSGTNHRSVPQRDSEALHFPALTITSHSQQPKSQNLVLNHHANLLQHLLKRKSSEKFSCFRCDEKFDSAVALGMHQYKSHPSSNKCKICKKIFPNYKSLNHHMQRHKEQGHEDSASRTLPPGLPQLLPIPSVAVSSHAPSMESSSSSLPASCNINHAQSEPLKIDPLELPFACIDCGQAFPRIKDLGDHRTSQHGSEHPFQCHHCSKVFAKSDGLRTHMKRHAEEKLFQCQTCLRRFVILKDLRNHERRSSCKPPSGDSEPKPAVAAFRCKICTVSCNSASDLAGHLTAEHIVDFSFQCFICSGIVDTLDEWQSHVLTHPVGSRPECPVCGKTISNRKNLWAHMKRHTDERNHHCTFCPSSFKVADDLKKHMKRHQYSSESQGYVEGLAPTNQQANTVAESYGNSSGSLLHFMLSGTSAIMTDNNQDSDVVVLE